MPEMRLKTYKMFIQGTNVARTHGPQAAPALSHSQFLPKDSSPGGRKVAGLAQSRFDKLCSQSAGRRFRHRRHNAGRKTCQRAHPGDPRRDPARHFQDMFTHFFMQKNAECMLNVYSMCDPCLQTDWPTCGPQELSALALGSRALLRDFAVMALLKTHPPTHRQFIRFWAWWFKP